MAVFQGNILSENGGGTKSLGLGGQGLITGSQTVTIETQNEWHFVHTMSADIGYGLTVNTGSTAAITVFADAGGGQITVTSNGHGLSNGDYISIVGTTNYNGVFLVANSQTNTFEITEAWNGDDGTGTWINGTNGVITAEQDGYYLYMWAVSCTAATANTVFDFAVFNGLIASTTITRKFATNTDAGAMAGHAIIYVTAGTHLAFAVKNTSNTANLTINNGAWSMFKIG